MASQTTQQQRQAGQGHVVVDMRDKDGSKTARKPGEPLFGPSIGIVSGGPGWTCHGNGGKKKAGKTVDSDSEDEDRERKKLESDTDSEDDELTEEIVQGWVRKAAEGTQPTTTLQALVNLKRPTLKLSPLQHEAEEEGSAEHKHHHIHALEFEFDCDAPKCAISVQVVDPWQEGFKKTTVFETVVDGGFSRALTLEEGAVLELGMYEHTPANAAEPKPAEASAPPAEANPASSTTDTATPENNNADSTQQQSSRARKRFTAHLHFRRRRPDVSGPALAVVDAEPPSAPAPAPGAAATPAAATGEAKKEEHDDGGVRVAIRLAAVSDESSTGTKAPENAQTTYLHVVRVGAPPAAASDGKEVEDERPWVVRVVKREARIGRHVFQLHEIYGLTSSSSAPTAAPAPLPAAHTYPPQNTAPTVPLDDSNDPTSECLLCLSSPREVVLLPCRHLVACKECALNMVEFGAGGTITNPQPEEPAPTAPAVASPTGEAAPAAGEGNAAGTAEAAATAPTAPSAAGAPAPATGATVVAAASPVTPTATTTRRKRKAKGWFCPVCRQPYTSLLRITTNPPPAAIADKEATSPEDGNNTEGGNSSANATEGSVQAPPSGGLLSSLRPNFLRSFSRAPNHAQV